MKSLISISIKTLWKKIHKDLQKEMKHKDWGEEQNRFRVKGLKKIVHVYSFEKKIGSIWAKFTLPNSANYLIQKVLKKLWNC